MIEVLACPGPATVQDLGRPGYRHLGVPLSGALDPVALRLANALAGNAAAAAGLELRLMGPQLRARQPVRIALAGVAAQIRRGDDTGEALPPWSSATLRAGDLLRIAAPAGGVAYLAVAGGIDVPAVLGSRSTCERAALGGLHGRAIRAGDLLPVGTAPPAAGELELAPAPLFADAGPLRVILGPQAGHFDDDALERFLGAEFRVGTEADRMGLRLAGPAIAHNARGADIVSDAVTPGAIQVPANGRPIVLLADCQTVGGYAKIATVIQADLPRLGRLLPGAAVRFAAVGRDDALAALREREAAIAATLAAMRPRRPAGGVDIDALYGANLVDGVIHAQ
jgi:biotin-dependent carboxylase-like uncharacterized protein